QRATSNLQLIEPHISPRILRIVLCILNEQILSLFAYDPGQSYFHLDVLVASHSVRPQAGHAALPQPKLLAGLSPGRNLEQCPSIYGWHLDFGSQRGFGHRNRNGAMNIVSLPLEVRVFADVRDDVEIARRAAQNSRIALAGNPDPRA